jgi:DNA-binding CsgD family transcriptional regulator
MTKGHVWLLGWRTVGLLAILVVSLSYIYLQQKNLSLSKKYVTITHEAIGKDKTFSEYHSAYGQLASYYMQTGNSILAQRHQNSSIIFKDDLVKQNDLKTQYQVETQLENEQRKLRETTQQEEKLKQVLIKNGLYISILLLLVIFFLYFKWTRLKAINRENRFLTQTQLAEADSKLAALQLIFFTDSIEEKNLLIEKASVEITLLKDDLLKLQSNLNRLGMQPDLPQDHIQQLKDFVILTEEDWIKFTILFHKVYPGFLTNIKIKIPDLSPAETRFVALSKLKLGNKEMAAMTGISRDAIRQCRSRINKKYGFSQEGNMLAIIDRI